MSTVSNILILRIYTLYVNNLQWQIQDFPSGGVDLLGGVNLRRGCFSVNIHAKMKELGPIGRGRVPEIFVCRSATDLADVVGLGYFSLCKPYLVRMFSLDSAHVVLRMLHTTYLVLCISCTLYKLCHVFAYSMWIILL